MAAIEWVPVGGDVRADAGTVDDADTGTLGVAAGEDEAVPDGLADRLQAATIGLCAGDVGVVAEAVDGAGVDEVDLDVVVAPVIADRAEGVAEPGGRRWDW